MAEIYSKQQLELLKGAYEDRERENNLRRSEMQSYYGYGNCGSVYSNTGPIPIFSGVYNGEKNEGSLGNAMNLLPDFRALRFRAYEAYLTNDNIRTVAGKYFRWVVGNGLKFQAEPYTKILQLEKIKEDLEAFKENTEAYFELWAKSTRSDYSGMCNLHGNAKKQYETKFLGGDVLVICRLDENLNLTVQIIDGQHVSNPLTDNSIGQFITAENGNKIIRGVEIDDKGKHVAYYVRKAALTSNTENSTAFMQNFDYERIAAIGKESGLTMVWMAYRQKHRIDHQRGITSLAAILEKAQKLDRFTEASVSKAEEVANMVYQVVHGKTSSGENPFATPIRERAGFPTIANPAVLGDAVAKQVQITEQKQAYNMPVDSELKAVSPAGQIEYEEFERPIFNQLSAAMDTPPEVARQVYNSNYSASRAAQNMWAFIIDLERDDLIFDFYQPIYTIWLYVHILKNKVSASGYLAAKATGNIDVIEAYSGAKFTGVKMPHIDPLKEINAIRAALGDDLTPLISFEQATELYNSGDWETNVTKFAKEKKKVTGLGLDPEPETVQQPAENKDDPNSQTQK